MIEITDTNYNNRMRGVQCEATETDILFTYTFNRNAKTISLFSNG